AILNAANEVAVAAFLDREIGFLEIAAIVEDTLSAYDPAAPESVDDVLAVDAEARSMARRQIAVRGGAVRGTNVKDIVA
ncbi:hypothetical protein PVV53_24510, partial [Salmonella enterica subsp. enterica serovar London]